MRLVLFLLTLLFASSQALGQEYKAQHGWGLPKQIGGSSVRQGVVLDRNRIIVAETAGLEARDADGQNPKLLYPQAGIRQLAGVGSGQDLALAWYQRDASNPSGVWWWFQNQASLAFETPYSDFVVLQVGTRPVLIGMIQDGAQTALLMQNWGQKPKEIYRTDLNIGALAAASSQGRIGIAFAEGYRNPQDEKYDLMLLELGKPVQKIAPAVYTGREQRYVLAVWQNRFVPVWWYETPEEQRIAALTKRHNPRLAFWDKDSVVEFAPPLKPLAQMGERLFYANKNKIYSLEFSSHSTRLEVLAPKAVSLVFVGQDAMLWQTLNQDGFSTQLWMVDKSQAYQPNWLDHVAATLGWNPWFVGQHFFGQTVLSLLFAVLVVSLIVPFVWLLRGRMDIGQGTWFGLAVGWMVLLGGRWWLGSWQTGDWAFAPLLNPPWWVVLLGVGLGSAAVLANHKKINGSELGATIASGLVILIGVFVMMFSRVGFLQF
jgi:hypothetical protein